MAFSASRSGTGPENSLAGWLWRWARKANAAGVGSGIWVSFAPRTGDKARRRQAGLRWGEAKGRRRPCKRAIGQNWRYRARNFHAASPRAPAKPALNATGPP